jgi:diacylglycerol O-acyltransferase / wax synthase
VKQAEVQSPAHYIEKVSLETGEVIEGDFRPEELLVQEHRDYHMVDTYARHLMSALMEATGDEERVKEAMKSARKLGQNTAELVAKAIHSNPKVMAEKMFGLKEKEHFFRYKNRLPQDINFRDKVDQLQDEAQWALERTRHKGRVKLRVLLTGGTGFVGKELMWQAASMPEITEMVVLIRPKTVRNREGEVIEVIEPAERGRRVLQQLWLDSPGLEDKFRFIAGDIEQPRLGVSDEDFEVLCRTITNVIHCAASVAFDDPYEESFRANVVGSRNALAFSQVIQDHPDSKFVSHLSIETSYIHGRQASHQAREDEIVFPRNYYNNYYELTKAMASIETEEAMIKNGLRVVQLCPAIVIGDGRTGNNRGDLKVVNAPVNAFGRARAVLKEREGDWVEWSKAKLLSNMAQIFPGDASAELNLIPVDWVASGILSALPRPQAVGERIHLATDSRITTKEIQTVIKEELRVKIKLSEPTLHRNFKLPFITSVLQKVKQPKVARALTKLDAIFGGYAERGQPVHQVGNDVEVLDMPEQRPVTLEVFRMLCRHNKYVQEFGQIRDLDEISRREKVWLDFCDELENTHDKPVGAIPPAIFHKALKANMDMTTFELLPFEKTRKQLLTKADSAWLHMDRPESLMMITALFLFKEKMDIDKLKETISERLLPYDRFRMRVKKSRNPLRRPSWVPYDKFDLDRHVVSYPLMDGTKEELFEFISETMSEPLDRSRPLWKFHLVNNLQDGGSALVCVLHHAIADGIALMKVLMNLTESPGHPEQTTAEPKGALKVKPSRFVDLARKGLGAVGVLSRGLVETEPRSPFRGPLSVAKKAAVSRPISLADIKTARLATHSTVNDILMAALAGGLRRYILREQGEIREGTDVRAVVPVDLRGAKDTDLGNKFGLIFMALPIGLSDPRERLLEVKKRMTELKGSPQAVIVLGLLAAVGAVPAELEKRVVTMFGSRATTVLTNVPGPSNPISLNGNEIDSIMFWVPQSGGLGLGLSILSYAGKVRVGVVADAGLVPDPEALVEDFEEAFEELLESQRQVAT